MKYFDHDTYWKLCNPQPGEYVKLHADAKSYSGTRVNWNDWVRVETSIDDDGDFNVYSRCMYWTFNVNEIALIRSK